MDKQAAVSGLFRGFFTGASWMRLALWARSGSREIVLRLSYQGGHASWKLTLNENGTEFWEGESSTLEDLTARAVVALGKTF